LKTEGLTKPDIVYTVSQITQLVKLELEDAFPLLWVEGEISNLRRYPSGHVYFTLKDPNAQLKAVLFRGNARQVAFEMKDGLQVICRGRLSVYEPRGDYQLIAEFIEPKGKGALQLAFEQLKEKLKAEGLFDPKFKKRLPLLPKKIGIVTSPRGAAIVDILRILERRFARLHILLYPAKVQGEGAAEEIVEGIDYLGKQPDIDVIIIGRGGGSMEDLWAFNEEIVARAIFRCPLPVISAVGHEIDFTIADFVADIRASTPSAAAEMVVEKEQAFEEKITGLEQRARQNLKIYLKDQQSRIFSLTHHRIFQNFKLKILNLGQGVDDLEMRAWKILRSEKQKISEKNSLVLLLSEKARNHMQSRLKDLGSQWETLTAGLNALSPLAVLKKGYALCWKDGGLRLVRKITEIEPGDDVTVSFYRGEFTARVGSVDPRRPLESHFLKEDS